MKISSNLLHLWTHGIKPTSNIKSHLPTTSPCLLLARNLNVSHYRNHHYRNRNHHYRNFHPDRLGCTVMMQEFRLWPTIFFNESIAAFFSFLGIISVAWDYLEIYLCLFLVHRRFNWRKMSTPYEKWFQNLQEKLKVSQFKSVQENGPSDTTSNTVASCPESTSIRSEIVLYYLLLVLLVKSSIFSWLLLWLFCLKISLEIFLFTLPTFLLKEIFSFAYRWLNKVLFFLYYNYFV